METKKLIEEKTKRLEELGKEIAQLQRTLSEKQVEALRVDGALSALKELNELPTKDKG